MRRGRRTACRPAAAAACRAGGSRRRPRRSRPSRASSVASRHGGAQRPFWLTADPDAAGLGAAPARAGSAASSAGVDGQRLLRQDVLARRRRPPRSGQPAVGPVAMSTMRTARVGQQLVGVVVDPLDDGNRSRTGSRGRSGCGSRRRPRRRRTARRPGGGRTARWCRSRGWPRRRGPREASAGSPARWRSLGLALIAAAPRRSAARPAGCPGRPGRAARTPPRRRRASTTSVTSAPTSTRPAATWAMNARHQPALVPARAQSDAGCRRSGWPRSAPGCGGTPRRAAGARPRPGRSRRRRRCPRRRRDRVASCRAR